MRTVVIPPPHGIGRYRTATVAARTLTQPVADGVIADLAHAGIAVRVQLGRPVGIWALTELTTAQEVHALTAFSAVTDSALAWHNPEATP
jgi:hypothetical protein